MDWKDRLKLFCSDKLPRLAGNLLMVFFCVLSVRKILSCGSTGNQFVVIFNVLIAWFYATVAALLLVRLYLPSVAAKISFGLLYPKKHLKNAPPMLSPVSGLIARGEFCEAEQQLSDLAAEYPGHAEIALMRIELYADKLKQPEQAAAAAADYFSRAASRKGDHHFRIVMRSADLVPAAGRETRLLEWLEMELKKNRLTGPQTAALKRRLDHLRS